MARDLGYRPNSGARAMRSGRFSSVVLGCPGKPAVAMLR